MPANTDPMLALSRRSAAHPPSSASYAGLTKHVLNDPLGEMAKWKALPKPTNADDKGASELLYRLALPLQSRASLHAAALPRAAALSASNRVEDYVQVSIATFASVTMSTPCQYQVVRPVSEFEHAHPLHPLCNSVVDTLLVFYAQKPLDLKENGVDFQPSRIWFTDISLTRLIDSFAQETGLGFKVGCTVWTKPIDPDTGEGEELYFCANMMCNKLRTHKMRCSACMVAWYCSKECQVVDWKARHKEECKELRAGGTRQGGS